MEGLKIRSRELLGGWAVLEVEGEVDLATVDELSEAIDGVFDDQSDDLVIDLTGSSFMDSTGLKALVMANRKFTDAERSFALVVKRGPIARLLELSGVDGTIKTVESLEDLKEG